MEYSRLTNLVIVSGHPMVNSQIKGTSTTSFVCMAIIISLKNTSPEEAKSLTAK